MSTNPVVYGYHDEDSGSGGKGGGGNSQKAKLSVRIKRHALLYVLLSFSLVWTIIFCYVPMAGIVMAFQDFNVVDGVFGSPFVGGKHFASMVTIEPLRRAVVNTVFYSALKLFFAFPLTIVFALMLNELRKMIFKRVVQTISYLPHFLSWIAIVSLFYSFFELYGPFNDIRLGMLGPDAARINILMMSEYFTGLMFWSHVYKEIGWGTIIYLAAIAGVDAQMYEAAVVDGCGRFKQAIYITLPSILPTIVILFILQAGGILNANFEQIIGLQNLYTQESSEVINTITYKYGLQQGRFSLATAFGLTQGVVSFMVMFTVNRITQKLSGIGVW
ncbi:MAG: ABC transporter permease subunit [Oscillospiraceae bacterium]|nr:ABC transporter permease subunit [Oscillospiraceae bacterium]